MNTVDRVKQLEVRVLRLEQQLKRMTSWPTTEPVPMPYRDTKKIKEHLEILQRKRNALSHMYADQHPVMVDIDRRIRWLKLQIELIEETPEFQELLGED